MSTVTSKPGEHRLDTDEACPGFYWLYAGLRRRVGSGGWGTCLGVGRWGVARLTKVCG